MVELTENFSTSWKHLTEENTRLCKLFEDFTMELTAEKRAEMLPEYLLDRLHANDAAMKQALARVTTASDMHVMSKDFLPSRLQEAIRLEEKARLRDVARLDQDAKPATDRGGSGNPVSGEESVTS